MKNNAKDLTLIDRDIVVEGTVSAKGEMIVKGTVKGTVSGEKVIIAEEGVVQADAKVSCITIGGAFEGNINADDELIVLSTGKCNGEILCKNFVVEAGGIIDAKVSCKSNKSLSKLGKRKIELLTYKE